MKTLLAGLITLLFSLNSPADAETDKFSADISCKSYAISAATAVASINNPGAIATDAQLVELEINDFTPSKNKMTYNVSTSSGEKTKIYQVDIAVILRHDYKKGPTQLAQILCPIESVRLINLSDQL